MQKSHEPIFVIQHHKSKTNHWDFRLEMNNTLKSWAITKQPPKTKGTKRLAIPTPNHPMNYADFEGTIPEGQYGAGTVKIWDKGTYKLIEKSPKKIEFRLKGNKLKGNYVLIFTGYGAKKNGWLFFKI